MTYLTHHITILHPDFRTFLRPCFVCAWDTFFSLCIAQQHYRHIMGWNSFRSRIYISIRQQTKSSNATSENSWHQTPKLKRCRVLQRRKGNRLLMFVTTKKHWLAKPHFRRFFLLSYAAFKMFPISLLFIHFTEQYLEISWTDEN